MNFALNLSVLRSEIASFHIWRLDCRSLRSEENPGAPLQGPEIVRYVDRQENCWKKLIAKCRFGELLNPGISTMQSIVLPISSVLGGQQDMMEAQNKNNPEWKTEIFCLMSRDMTASYTLVCVFLPDWITFNSSIVPQMSYIVVQRTKHFQTFLTSKPTYFQIIHSDIYI